MTSALHISAQHLGTMDLLTLDRLPSSLRDTITVRNLTSEHILFRQGDAASAFFVVTIGRIRVVRHTPEHQLTTLQIARPGESFGESALFEDSYAYTAVAEVPAQVNVYPKQPLLAALREYPDLASDFMTVLVKRNLALVMQLELRDIRAVHKRLLHYLRYAAEPNAPGVVSFDRPLKQIALDLGLAPATLSRALKRLEQEGMIIREQNLIRLQNSSVA